MPVYRLYCYTAIAVVVAIRVVTSLYIETFTRHGKQACNRYSFQHGHWHTQRSTLHSTTPRGRKVANHQMTQILSISSYCCCCCNDITHASADHRPSPASCYCQCCYIGRQSIPRMRYLRPHVYVLRSQLPNSSRQLTPTNGCNNTVAYDGEARMPYFHRRTNIAAPQTVESRINYEHSTL